MSSVSDSRKNEDYSWLSKKNGLPLKVEKKPISIKKYVSIHNYQEKVEKRTYRRGFWHWYIYGPKSGRWYRLAGFVININIINGTIIPDTGEVDFLQKQAEYTKQN
ncbi:MAG TPA: hypothetical protein VIK40_05185 [Geomonas sp.]